jgi:multidrug efflux pump subunit AcrA (membrane-fusion protein)
MRPSVDLRVHRGQLSQRYLLTGTIEAVSGARIQVPATREYRLQIQWLVEDGSTVTAGDRVLEFDASSFTSDLDRQRTAVQSSLRSRLQIRAQGEARLKDGEAAVERARISLEKARLDASVPVGLHSRYDHRNAQLALARAEAEYAKSVADLQATTASVESDIQVNEEEHRKLLRELKVAEDAVVKLSLEAPRDGIAVVERHPWEDRKFQVGDSVFTGWPVVGIPDLESLRVRASLSDVDDGHLEVGMPAVCTPDIEPELHLPGRVTEITSIAREQRYASERRVFDVVIELEGAWGDTLLVPGMSVRVEVGVPGEEALLAPRAAVDFSTDPPRIRRFDGQRAEVRLGQCSATDCVVIEGLADGDRLSDVADQGI